jgi:hypothetical protein
MLGLFVGALLSISSSARADCAKIEEASKVDRSLGTLLGLADCEERSGRVASAWTHWGEAAALAEKARDRRAALAGHHRDALAKRLPKIQLDIARPATPPAPGALDVYRDEVRIDPAYYGVPLPTDPGPHVVSVRRGAEVLRSQQVNATEGQTSRVALDLAALERAPAPPAPVAVAPPPAPAPAPVAAAPPPAPVTAAPPSGRQKLIGYATIGVGAAAVAAALGLEIVALIDRTTAFASDSCSNGFCTQAGSDAAGRARAFANTGQWVGIGGIVVAAAGVVLVFTAPKGVAAPRTAVSLSGWAAPGGGGIGLRGVLR